MIEFYPQIKQFHIFIALLSVVSPSLKQIAALEAPVQVLAWAVPAAFVWVALEAGLSEEFLFRAVLQTRLAAVLRSEFLCSITSRDRAACRGGSCPNLLAHV